MLEPSYLLDPHEEEAAGVGALGCIGVGGGAGSSSRSKNSNTSANTMVEDIKRASLKYNQTRQKQSKKQPGNIAGIHLPLRGVEFYTQQHLQHSTNLNDLNAYVKHTLQEQRLQRRRQCVVRSFLVLVFVLGVIATSLTLVERKKMQEKLHSGSGLVSDGYELSRCEREVNHNRTFYQMVQMMEETNQTHCRADFPNNCDWVNPTHAQPPQEVSDSYGMTQWRTAVDANLEEIYQITHNNKDQNLDVVLIGDSIVEHMEGTYMGIQEHVLQNDHDVFEELFNTTDGGSVNGLALGIDGDRIANLLFRLENGEMPTDFNPKLWWIVVGTEDWGAGLDANAIVAGIVKIVHAIQYTHPKAKAVVINSLLPRGDEGEYYGDAVYDSMRDINSRLQCYADSHHGHDNNNYNGVDVEFFDATDIFIEKNPRNKEEYVNGELEPDYIHPNAEGELMWGKQIVSKVLELTRDEE